MENKVETFIPWGPRLLVRRIESSRMTPGGLHIPEQSRDLYQLCRGEVVRVGPGERKPYTVDEIVPSQFKVGDTILYREGVSFKLNFGEVDYELVTEHDVMAKIETGANG